MRLIDADKLYAVLENIADHFLKTKSEPDHTMAQTIQYVMGIVGDQPDIAPPPNDPLTLEQLRGMDGEPVYVHWVKCDWQMGGEWAFVCLKWQGCKTATGGAVFFDRYGEWWIAYRRKPEEGAP